MTKRLLEAAATVLPAVSRATEAVFLHHRLQEPVWPQCTLCSHSPCVCGSQSFQGHFFLSVNQTHPCLKIQGRGHGSTVEHSASIHKALD